MSAREVFMRFFKALTFIVLMGLVSVSMTGCDASKIIDVISKVAEGVQKAIPAIKEVVNTVSNALPQNTNNDTTANNTTTNNNNEQTASNNANVTITSAGDDEDVSSSSGTAANGSIPALTRPNGRAEIERIFGARGTNQVTVNMAAGPNGSSRAVTCHRLIAQRLKAVFDEIKSLGLSNLITTFDGCFNNRNKRGGSTPSVHSWGIAVDLNASANPMGSSNMTAGQRRLAEVFKKYGFYQLPNDPMHFQYCTGY